VEAAAGEPLSQLFDDEGFLRRLGKPGALRPTPPRPAPPGLAQPPSAGVLRGGCPKCGKRLRIVLQKLPTGDQARVTCPACKQIFILPVARILKAQLPLTPVPSVGPKSSNVRVVKRACPKCRKVFVLALDRLPKTPYVDVQCGGCQHKYRLSLVEVGAGAS